MKNSNQKKGYLWKSMISYIIVFAMALSVCPPLYVEASQWTSSGYNGCAGLEVLEKALENDQAPIFMIKDGKIMPYSAVYSANVGDTVALTYGMRDYNLFGASGTTDVGRYRYAMMGSYMRLPTSAWWLDTARNAGDLQYTGSNAKSVDQLKIEIPGRGTKKVHEWFGMTADDFIEFNEMFFTMSHYRGGWPVNEVKVYEADVDGNDGYAAGEKPSKNSPEVVDDNMGTIYTGNAIEWRNGYRNAIYGYNSTRSGKFAGERIWEAIKRSGVAASKESWSVWSKGHNVAPSPLPTNEAGVQPTPSGNVATNYGHWDDVKALVDTPEFRWVVYPYLWLIAKTNGNSWNDANGKFVSNRIVGVKEIEITSDMLGVNNSLNDNGPLITGELVKKQSGSTWKDKEWQMVGTKLRVLPEVEPGEVPDTKEIDDNIYGTLEIGKVGQKFEGVKWGSSLTLEIATNAMSAGTLTHLAYKIVGGPGDVAAMVDQNTAQTMKLEANANPTQNPWTTPGPTTPPSSEVPSKDAHTIVLDKDTLTSQLYFEKPGTYKLRVEVFTNIPEQFWNVGQPFPYNGEYEALEKPRSLGFTTFEVVVGKGSIQLVKDNEEVTYTNLNAVDTYADKLDYNGKDQDCTLYKTLPKFKHSDITNGRWYPIAADDNQLFERKKVGTVKNVGDELEGEIGGGSIFTNPWSDYLTILPEGAKYSFTVAPLEIAGTWMRRVMGVPQYSTWKNADYDVDFPVYKNANYTIDTALSFDTSAFDGIQPAPQITYQKAIWDKEVQDNFTTLLNNAIADLQAKFAILEGLLAQTNPPATSAAIASAQAAYNQAEVVVAELGEAQKQGFFIPIGSGESNYSRYEQKDVKMYNGEIDRTLVTVRAISSNPNIVFTDYNIFGVTINPYAVSADFYTYLDANYPIGQTSWNPPPVPLSELDDVKIIPSSLVDTYKVEFTVTRTEGTTGDYLLDNLKILNSSNEQDFNYRCNVPGPVSASDKNGNGMPDWWEFEVNDDEFLSQYGDEDNDGIPNFVEFLFTFADVEFAIEYAAKYGYNCNPELDGHHFPLKKVYGVSNTVPANMSQFKGTNPCNADTDGDGYDDYYEYFFGLRENYDTTARFNAHNAKFNPTIAGLNSYNTQNLDDSGLTLKQNHILWLRGLAINPVKPSTADDSYTDGWKILVSGLAQDEDFAITDSKLASDDFDITSLAFNPTHSCSNGTATAANGMMSPLAKFTWWKEKGTSLTKANILNPLVASTADDGIYDGWKVFWEFNPLSAISATQISHTGSGMTDRAKFDWWKLKGYPLTEGRVLNPKAADTDGDGWNDDVEIAAGTDPLNAQSFPNIVPPPTPKPEGTPHPANPSMPEATRTNITSYGAGNGKIKNNSNDYAIDVSEPNKDFTTSATWVKIAPGAEYVNFGPGTYSVRYSSFYNNELQIFAPGTGIQELTITQPNPPGGTEQHPGGVPAVQVGNESEWGKGDGWLKNQDATYAIEVSQDSAFIGGGIVIEKGVQKQLPTGTYYIRWAPTSQYAASDIKLIKTIMAGSIVVPSNDHPNNANAPDVTVTKETNWGDNDGKIKNNSGTYAIEIATNAGFTTGNRIVQPNATQENLPPGTYFIRWAAFGPYKAGTTVLTRTVEPGAGAPATPTPMASPTPVGGIDWDKDWSDVPSTKNTANEWWLDAVKDMIIKGIINGMGKTADGKNYFDPEGKITRAQFCQILAKMSGENWEGTATSNKFSDIKNSTQWYVAAVSWCSGKDIVRGYDEAGGGYYFNPEALITRQEITAMINRFAAYKNVTLPTDQPSTFTDVKSGVDWGYEDVTKVAKAGIVKGMGPAEGGGTYFAPQENTRRNEAATMLYRLLQLMD